MKIIEDITFEINFLTFIFLGKDVVKREGPFMTTPWAELPTSLKYSHMSIDKYTKVNGTMNNIIFVTSTKFIGADFIA